MGTCWCKLKPQHISEPYVPSAEPQLLASVGNRHQPTPQPGAVRNKNMEIELIDQLVREMLRTIAAYVDNNEMPPALIHLHMLAEQEQGWINVISSVINVTPLDNPFGPSLITVLLDDCPLPSKHTVVTWTRMFQLSTERAMERDLDVRTEANLCAVLGCIAERQAGPNCVAMLTEDTLDYLCTFLIHLRNPHLILFALFTLEKFALTADNKVRIKERFSRGRHHLLRMLEVHINDVDPAWAQVGFCAQWALDNIFVIEGRQLTYETIDMTGINAILNSHDVSEYLKISSDGLTARSDSYSFESVRCTFQVDEGCWYYECTIMTRGVMQIGWATKNSHFLSYEGYGVGDDLYSVSYDGCRMLIWHKAGSNMVMDAVGWAPGDVLGCMLDLLEKEVVFYLNGVPLAVHSEIFNASRSGFFAAASFMTYQQCRFNFGNRPYQFPPTDRQFLSFNDFAELDEEERTIIPRRLLIAKLREMVVDENACTLCCDALACCILEPCRHMGFCSVCTSQLKDCPMCRGPIMNVAIVSCNDDDDEDARADQAIALRNTEDQGVNDFDVMVTR